MMSDQKGVLSYLYKSSKPLPVGVINLRIKPDLVDLVIAHTVKQQRLKTRKTLQSY